MQSLGAEAGATPGSNNVILSTIRSNSVPASNLRDCICGGLWVERVPWQSHEVWVRLNRCILRLRSSRAQLKFIVTEDRENQVCRP